MTYIAPLNLLGSKNTKTVKGEKFGWKTFILYLASGTKVCSHASKGCLDACLNGSGRGGMYSSVQKSRQNKTNYLFSDRQMFLSQLYIEIKRISDTKKKGEKICIRLNGTSDLAWEKFNVKDGKNIMELFPDIMFYDYTKNYLRFDRVLPKNYHLTFSRSESNEIHVERLLAKGVNVAIVFDKLPTTYKGYTVINGDLSDLRFNDEKNVVVGLKYKKLTGAGSDNKKVFETGFALKIENLETLATLVA